MLRGSGPDREGKSSHNQSRKFSTVKSERENTAVSGEDGKGFAEKVTYKQDFGRMSKFRIPTLTSASWVTLGKPQNVSGS